MKEEHVDDRYFCHARKTVLKTIWENIVKNSIKYGVAAIDNGKL